MYLADDLQKRLNFIDETYQYSDYKPFFTDMWAILAALLRFEICPASAMLRSRSEYCCLRLCFQL